MGGSGSGNWYRFSKKDVVEDCLVLDANRWTREGILAPDVYKSGTWGWIFSSGRECSISYDVCTLDEETPSVRLIYTTTSRSSEPRSMNYCVSLTTTRPHFGGLRWWFLCPLVSRGRLCNRRVGKLYSPPGASYFGCRQCYDLTYTTCQESHKFDGFYRLMAAKNGWDLADVKEVMRNLQNRQK